MPRRNKPVKGVMQLPPMTAGANPQQKALESARMNAQLRGDPDHDWPAAKALMALGAGCKWPIGEVRSTDFHFCGAKREPKDPYCAAHMKRRAAPLPPKRLKA